MIRQPLKITILLSGIFLLICLFPTTIRATDCSDMGGHCNFTAPGACANGDLGGDCPFPLRCCANDPQPGTCQAEGGHCNFVAPSACVYGPGTGTCPIGLTCCANYNGHNSDDLFCSENGSGTTNNPSSGIINTALGCLPTKDLQRFIGVILPWAISVGGGLALLLLIFSGFLIMTSSGDPRKLQAGKELLGAAIGGIVFLVASVYILRLIGVDILQVPGFS